MSADVILLVLICAPAMCGCASLALNDSFFADTSSHKSSPSTIRSQSSPESENSDLTATTPVPADYSPLRVSSGANDGITGDIESKADIAPVYASGHSFVQRRARLGRPIPLPEETPARTDPVLPVKSASVRREGLDFGNSGWQPIPNSTSDPTSNSESQDERSRSTELDSSINEESLSPPGSNTPGESDPNSDSGSTGNNLIDDGGPIAKEPTVFERLRGFYIPRREESPPDHSRKTPRRWTAPFGRLWDWETENGEPAVGATTTFPENTDSGTSGAISLDPNAKMPASEDLLEPMIAQLEQELSDWRKSPAGRPENEADWLRRQTDLRMLYLMAGQSAKSVQVIESLSEKEQEFWQSMMLAMESYRRHDDSVGRAEQLTETLNYVRTASRQLQSLSTMGIRRLNFCNRIDGFGAFSVFPTSDFNAGQPLLLYAEIENYKSELTSDGQYRSEFDAMIEFIREGETDPITDRTIRLNKIEDLCSAERTDYFQSYQITVPVLSPGKYIIRLRIRDQLSQQTATTELPFDIRPLGSAQ